MSNVRPCHRSGAQETDADVLQEVNGRRDRAGQMERLSSGAALTGSQLVKLERQVTLQMSQIQARGHMALSPLCGRPLMLSLGWGIALGSVL